MAYNYSPWLLEANKELVDYLIQLAQTGEQAQAVFDDADSARTYRLKVLELLANLARNRPELAHLRGKIRTNIKFEGERYAVIVGVLRPEQKLRGARPQLPAGITADTTVYGVELRIIDEITQASWATIGPQLAAARGYADAGSDKAPDRIILTVLPPPEGIEALAEMLLPFYEVRSTKPHLIFERQRTNVNTSAIIASASQKRPS